MLLAASAPGVLAGTIPNSIGAGLAAIQISNTGAWVIIGAAGGNWIEPASATVAAYYQVKVDVTSGTLTSGTTGTWIDCSTGPQWTEDSGGATITMSFREKASQTVRKVQTGITLTAT
jgi:hypothetical protein